MNEEELLFGLTPQEGWAWKYLLLLAQRQGSAHIILPRPGEDLKAEKVFCRKHLKNLLKALKVKRHLTNLIFPRSKSQQIEVLLPASKIGELQFPNVEKGLLEFPNNEARGNHSSPIKALGNCSSSIMEVISDTLPENTPAQASLKESLKALIKQKQGDMIREILKLSSGQVYQMQASIRLLKVLEPQGRNLSEQAKLFAKLRFLQKGGRVDTPGAWITSVAQAGQREIDRWKGGRSESVGRLLSPEISASG
jgi:hypothetical protein